MLETKISLNTVNLNIFVLYTEIDVGFICRPSSVTLRTKTKYYSENDLRKAGRKAFSSQSLHKPSHVGLQLSPTMTPSNLENFYNSTYSIFAKAKFLVQL